MCLLEGQAWYLDNLHLCSDIKQSKFTLLVTVMLWLTSGSAASNECVRHLGFDVVCAWVCDQTPVSGHSVTFLLRGGFGYLAVVSEPSHRMLASI